MWSLISVGSQGGAVSNQLDKNCTEFEALFQQTTLAECDFR
jgi:hypothetical protein